MSRKLLMICVSLMAGCVMDGVSGDGYVGEVSDEISAGPGQKTCDPSITNGFGGGSGTGIDPYLICSVTQLRRVEAGDGPASYKLAANLDLAGIAFPPLGKLRGAFNGAGWVISRWSYTGSHQELGLWNLVEGSVRNLNLDQITLSNTATSGSRTGALVGLNTGTVENCYLYDSEVRSSARDASTGGLVGENYGGSIRRSRVTDSTVSASHTSDDIPNAGAGGIVGVLNGGTIDSSLSYYGAVYGGPNAGGLVGSAVNTSRITRCSAHTTVGGTGSVGGLVGLVLNGPTIEDSGARGHAYRYDGSGGAIGGLVGRLEGHGTGPAVSKIRRSYSVADVDWGDNIDRTYVGAFIGTMVDASTVTSSYALEAPYARFIGHTELGAGGSIDGLSMEKTSAQLKTRSTFVGWTFVQDGVPVAPWTLPSGNYPRVNVMCGGSLCPQ